MKLAKTKDAALDNCSYVQPSWSAFCCKLTEKIALKFMNKNYLAYSIARVSRITVTLIVPG